MNFVTKMAVAVLPLTLLAACASTPEEQAVAPATDTGVMRAEPSMDAGAEAMGAGDAGGFRGSPLDDPNSLLSKRVIYFDFDKSDVRPEFRDIVQAHAAYQAQNPNTRVTLEGHADERGTREYNMGLGERRAMAVRNMLTLQGASGNQVDTVSYGEERPAAMGNDEQSWGLNRRVEIIYH